MNFEELSFWDQQEIQNSLGTALASYAIGPDSKDDPLAHGPMERAEADAQLVFDKGWAVQVDGKWEVNLESYLEFRSKS